MGAVDSLDLRALGKISQDVMAVLQSGVLTLGGFVAAVDAHIAARSDESVHESWARLRIVGSPLQRL